MYREASPDVRIFKTQCLVTPPAARRTRRTLRKRESEDGRVLAALTEQGRSRREFAGPPISIWRIRLGRGLPVARRVRCAGSVVSVLPGHSAFRPLYISTRISFPDAASESLALLLPPPSFVLLGSIRTQCPIYIIARPPEPPPSCLLPPTSPAPSSLPPPSLSPPYVAAMQVPTLRNVHIRSAADAHKLFYAVQLGILPKIDKRLDANERAALRPGDVYVWEEKGPNTDSFSVSMERFTEGKSWTASRVREVRPAAPFAPSRSHVARAGLPHVLREPQEGQRECKVRTRCSELSARIVIDPPPATLEPLKTSLFARANRICISSSRIPSSGRTSKTHQACQ